MCSNCLLDSLFSLDSMTVIPIAAATQLDGIAGEGIVCDGACISQYIVQLKNDQGASTRCP